MSWQVASAREEVLVAHPRQRRGLATEGREGLAFPLVAFGERVGVPHTCNTMFHRGSEVSVRKVRLSPRSKKINQLRQN